MHDAEHPEAQRPTPVRADYYRYERRTDDDPRNWVSIDKTTAMILGAIASAALAVAIAGGTALVGKVEDTAKEVEKTRNERIATNGDMSRDISIVETKLNQLMTQIQQQEFRLERGLESGLSARDKRLDDLEKEVNRLRDQMLEYARPVRPPIR